jgi:hypothetical protein
MAYIYGRKITKKELMKRVGDISQVAGARQCTLRSGRSAGVDAVDVRTGGGLSFTVLPDRGMDIAWAEYKGIALSFISKTGVVSPYFYEPEGKGFLRSFSAGLLTTCGLTYMGAACEDEGKPLGLHGRASNTPAADVCVTNEWEADEFIMTVRGRVRESAVFGENITLLREIRTRLGENRIKIKDTVENCGFESQPLMLLYHFNFGYPLLDGTAGLILPEGRVRARDEAVERGIGDYKEFSDPVHGYSEQVFYHDFTGSDDQAVVGIFNEALCGCGLGVYLKYDRRRLPYLIEWKQTGEGDYAVGLEPATWYPEGRSEARRRGELTYIEAGEVKNFEIELEVSEGGRSAGETYKQAE